MVEKEVLQSKLPLLKPAGAKLLPLSQQHWLGYFGEW